MFEQSFISSFRDEASLANIFVRSRLNTENKITGTFKSN